MDDEPVIAPGLVVLRTHPDILGDLGSILGDREGERIELETRGVLHIKFGGTWLYFVDTSATEGDARVVWATLDHPTHEPND